MAKASTFKVADMKEEYPNGKKYVPAVPCFPGSNLFTKYWSRFWLRFAGQSLFGKMAARFCCYNIPPHKGRVILAQRTARGFVEASATIYHNEMYLGKHCYLGDRVMIFQREKGRSIHFGNHVYIYRDCILETGCEGRLIIDDYASLHPRCQINANVADIHIGKHVMIGPNCALYSYDHGIALGQPIRKQPLESKGPVVVHDEVWLGVGVTVLSGVEIGKGAVIAAGSVVTSDVPENAVAAGVPAKIISNRKPQGK